MKATESKQRRFAMKSEDNVQEAAKISDTILNVDDCRLMVDESTPVEGEDSILNMSDTGSAFAVCVPPRPDSTYGTYNSSDKDDIITDDDIAFFLEEKPCASNIPVSCAHLHCVQPVPKSGIDVQAACVICNSTDENWICLTCYQVYCSRYVNKHMVQHTQDSKHTITLSLRDVSVWCYSCDDYVYDDVLKDVIKLALDAKYGSPTEALTNVDSFQSEKSYDNSGNY